MALLVLRAAVLLGLFLLFRRLELRGRGVVVVLTVLAVPLLDAVFYPSTTSAKAESIFHPDIAGQSFRLTQLVVPVALAARLSVRGFPRRVDASTPLWLAFFAWVMVQTAVGLLEGHNAALVLRQASIVVHVGGGIALAASVPARDYVTGSAVPRFLQASAAVAVAVFVTDTFGSSWAFAGVPDLPISELGVFGADAATLFSGLGVLGLVLAAVRPGELPGRWAVLIPSVLLILSHLGSSQRAARLGLYVSLLLLLALALTPTARRRIALTSRHVVTAAVTVVVAALAVVFTAAVVAAFDVPEQAPYSGQSRLGELAARDNPGSIESRFNQWDIARGEIQQAPLLGHGLGARISYYELSERSLVSSDITHNVVVDLLLRTGGVGLLLAASAVLVVWAQALGTWRHHLDDRVAALAVGAVAVSAGVLAKGMVESVFEKHRLALFLGVLLGLAVSAALSESGLRREPGRLRDGQVPDGARVP